jgi:hypothetical protein
MSLSGASVATGQKIYFLSATNNAHYKNSFVAISVISPLSLAMQLRPSAALLLLALSSSLLLLAQLAAAQQDPSACSDSCRFIVVPTLGPAGPPGLNGTDGINGKDGVDGLNGVDGKDGKDGLFVVEYMKVETQIHGNFEAAVELEFFRSGPHVTMLLGSVHQSGTTTSGIWSDNDAIPPQFRPVSMMAFAIPGTKSADPVFLCIQIAVGGAIHIYGGGCLVPFDGGNALNGWQPTALHWVTA